MNKKILKNKINRFYATLATVDIAYDNCIVSTEDLNNISVLNEVLYDLEDNFFTFEGIYELHRQVLKHMHKIETYKKTCCNVAIAIGIVGILLAIGIAGSDQLGSISFLNTLIGSGISLGLMGIGSILYIKGEN